MLMPAAHISKAAASISQNLRGIAGVCRQHGFHIHTCQGIPSSTLQPQGDYELASALISNAANIDATGDLGNRPLHVAAAAGHARVSSNGKWLQHTATLGWQHVAWRALSV
jgi:hypothetical protein